MKGDKKVELVGGHYELTEIIEKWQAHNVWKMVDCIPCAWETEMKNGHSYDDISKTEKRVTKYLVIFEKRS